jgi:SAM-dependent methyltransferase
LSAPIFAGGYARLYDAMYAGKDYSRECDAVEAAIRRHGDRGAYRAILDLGCGTGGHAIPLASRGYDVLGADLSPDMVAIARSKAAVTGVDARFDTADMRTVDLGRTFDVVLILFAALGYQTADADVAATLSNARRHLRPGGLLILDVWNAPTVLAEGVRDRIRILERGDRQLIKASMRTLDPGGTVVDVRVRVWDIVGTRVVGTADETHRMRPFSRAELERLLGASGLGARTFFEFPDLDQPPREGTFDLGCVAIATDPPGRPPILPP